MASKQKTKKPAKKVVKPSVQKAKRKPTVARKARKVAKTVKAQAVTQLKRGGVVRLQQMSLGEPGTLDPVQQLRQTADDLSAAADNAAALADMHTVEEAQLRQFSVDLSTQAKNIRQIALAAFATSLGDALATVTAATAKAKQRLDTLDNLAKAIGIFTKLLALGVAIATVNVQGAITAATGLASDLSKE